MLDFRAHLADKFGAGALAMPSPDRTLMWSSPMTNPIPELTPEHQARFWRKVDVRGPDECWPWLAGTNTDGYGQFWAGPRNFYAHRIALALNGRDPGELLALHTCDNPSCCNPSHLWLGTNADNITDRDAKGRQACGERNGSRTKPESLARGERHYSRTKPECLPRGERNGRAKVTAADIPVIRADPRKQGVIAAEYGVHRTLIGHIKRREIWAHVK